jgi:RNA-directed DNA polymerase
MDNLQSSGIVQPVSLFNLENLFKQYAACRKNKRNTINALRFEAQQELQLIALQEALVNHLEKIWEPIFIHDSYACRKGKGVHAAVARLQTFMRQAMANGTREAFTLQLDIRNYFMTIDKPRLLAMINAKLPSTTHYRMSQLEFMQRLAALVPQPRLHLIRFLGVLGQEPTKQGRSKRLG